MPWYGWLTVIGFVICMVVLGFLIWWVARQIYYDKHPAKSATLHFKGASMPATILVGATATAVFTEFTGPGGTGVTIPPIGAVSFPSDNPAIATVDPASGIATGVSAGTANISGTDAGNSLTASDVLTVTAAVAESATLVLTAPAS